MQEPDVFYTCSMHPQIMQNTPGDCPICGMELIKVEKKKAVSDESIMLSDQQIQLGNIQVDTIGSVKYKAIVKTEISCNLRSNSCSTKT